MIYIIAKLRLQRQRQGVFVGFMPHFAIAKPLQNAVAIYNKELQDNKTMESQN